MRSKEPLVKGGQGRPDILEEDVKAYHIDSMWFVTVSFVVVMAACAVMIYG
jgi:hypothetical protein